VTFSTASTFGVLRPMTRNGWDEVSTLSSHRNNAGGPVPGRNLLGYLARDLGSLSPRYHTCYDDGHDAE
jgi:hypothetical protein